MADQGLFQLRKFTNADLAPLLRAAVEKGKSAVRTKQWLKRVWREINKRSISLSQFEDLPIIPGRFHGESALHTYKLTDILMCKKSDGMDSLTEKFSSALRHLGVAVLNHLADFVSQHGQIFGHYVQHPVGVLKCLARVQASGNQEPVENFNSKASAKEKEAMVESICKHPDLASAACLLKRLKLFTDSEGQPACLSDVSTLAPPQRLPVRLPTRYIVAEGKQRELALKLKAREASVEDVICEVLGVLGQPGQNLYKESDKQNFMKLVLESRLTAKVVSAAKGVHFLKSSKASSLKRACDLFDPESDVLMGLFKGEERFPFPPDAHQLAALRKLGLKQVDDVKGEDITTTARIIEALHQKGDEAQALQKAQKLVDFLTLPANRVKLSSFRLENLHDVLYWPCMTSKPSSFPDAVPFPGAALARPSKVFTDCNVQLVGSVASVSARTVDANLGTFLGLRPRPPPKLVVEQARTLISSYSPRDGLKFAPMIMAIYDYLSAETLSDDIASEFQDLHFIWAGENTGFCKPNAVWLKKSERDLGLEPYKMTIPPSMEKYRDFFLKVGAQSEQTVDMLEDVLKEIAAKLDGEVLHQKKGKKDLRLVIQILNRLAEEEDIADRCVPVPICTGHQRRLLLRPAPDCTYCDSDWLLDEDPPSSSSTQDENDILFVHRDVPKKTAIQLGVMALKSRVMGDVEDMDENYGQTEPLTRRLHNLLKDYTDGLAVPKELVQNADDAGATVVKFLHDQRQNRDARHFLFDAAYGECQGPALWAFNDALFTEEDFKNITKLSGATKESCSTKIGRFGLGFNAVYNLTDVPSFASGSTFAIFDPHKRFLGDQRPGLKVDLRKAKNRKMIEKMKDQFKPFHGVFGCNPQADSNAEVINGTLFRLPLRTVSQADKSEIKQIPYTKQAMKDLFAMLFENVGSILLFTQSVTTIEVYTLAENSTNASKPILVGRCLKSDIKSLSPEKPLMLFDQHWKEKTDPPKIEQTLRISVTHGKRSKDMDWRVQWAQGLGTSMDMCRRGVVKGLLPVAATAVPICIKSANRKVDTVALKNCSKGFLEEGHLYCFLPLPIPSSLPVHVNAAFAVTSNRRQLVRQTTDDKESPEGAWNQAVTEDAVSRAYVLLLQGLALQGVEDESSYYDAWPTATSRELPQLQRAFFTAVARQDHKVFPHPGGATSLQSAILLDSSARGEERQLMLRTMKAFLERDGKIVIDPPEKIVKIFGKQDYALQKDIRQHTRSLEDFFESVFLPNIQNIGLSEADRDKILRFGLRCERVRHLMEGFCCIPSSPNGALKKPADLIDPYGLASALFSDEEERFPAEGMRERDILQSLHKLRMQKDEISSNLLVERVRSVQHLAAAVDQARAIERSKRIIKYLMHSVGSGRSPDSDVKYFQMHEEVGEELSSLPFLPVLPKPSDWPSSWRNDGSEARFANPRELFFFSCADLIGTSQLVLDESQLDLERQGEYIQVFHWLRVRGKVNIVKEEVTQQLLLVASERNLQKKKRKRQLSCCRALYVHLENVCKRLSEEKASSFLREKLRDQPVLLHHDEFTTPESLVFELDRDCKPYLMKTNSKNFNFLKAAGVRSQCSVSQILSILKKIAQKTRNKLPPREIKSVVDLATVLADLVRENSAEKPRTDEIFLPDRNGCLLPVSQLCLDDCPWIEESDGMRFLNDNVAPETAKILGVKSKRDQDVQSMLEIISWGQEETLTTRLKKLLAGYPRDATILKEILQNADDAGATEVKLILDDRNHATEKLMAESFAPLQGPALCVYNNSHFTEKDIEGIKNLGQGSKGEDLVKTGQFGVGFNAVYHLTDAPSFLTVGPDMPRRLCVMDPLCKYVPGARKGAPGGMFLNIDGKRQNYPDQLGCYLEAQLDMSTRGTVFRLPLRTEESQVSNKTVCVEDLTELLQEFKAEVFDALIFLRSVSRVGIYHVDQEGQLEKDYEVTVSKSDEDQESLRAFYQHLDQEAERMKSHEEAMNSLTPSEVIIKEELQDNFDKRECWLVVNKLGFSTEREIPRSVDEAWRRGELKHLPRGAVALPLNGVRDRQSRFRAFCTLPLPIETGLPVHVNGMFILDHESRRNLWKGTPDYRTAWNDHLSRCLIVPAYLDALDAIKTDWFLHDVNADVNLIRERMHLYHDLFPTRGTEEFWSSLRKSFYQNIMEKEAPLFPVLHIDESSASKCELQTVPVTSTQGFPGYFNDLTKFTGSPDEAVRLAAVLKKLGMKILEAPLSILDAFREVTEIVEAVTPKNTAAFLKSFCGEKEGHCRLEGLPKAVEETPLGTVQHACQLLWFCGRRGESSQIVQDFPRDLPLAVLSDGQLDVFGRRPVFVSDYLDLLPGSPNEFLHALLVPPVKDFISQDGAELKPLDVSAFSNLLQATLSPSEWQCDVKAWDGNHQGPGGKDWMKRLWKFLDEEARPHNPFDGQDTIRKHLLQALAPLRSWSLLPALTPDRQPALYRLGSPWQVYFGSDQGSTLCAILDRVPLPRLHVEALGESHEMAKKIISSVENPAGLLRCLASLSDFPGIAQFEAHQLLSFFLTHTDGLRPEVGDIELKSLLKGLQLYGTLGGDLTRITNNSTTICVQESLPESGINEWSEKVQYTMLRSTCIPKALLEYLEVKTIDAQGFYADFLLPHFLCLPRESFMNHLEYIRDKLLWRKQQNIIDRLKNVTFVVGGDDKLHLASEFYSPKIDVFEQMCPEKFPPSPFCKQAWYEFMLTAGMVNEVTMDMYIRFAQQLAGEGTGQLTPVLERKSTVLVQHLFDSRNLLQEGLMTRIRDIAFVRPYDLNHRKHEDDINLLSLHEQAAVNGLVSFSQSQSPRYSHLVWTSCSMVHPDCDPLMRQEGIAEMPPLSAVVTHLRRVCRRLSGKTPEDMAKLLHVITPVMRSNYNFLQTQQAEKLKEELRDSPVIYLPQENKVAAPCEVLLDIRAEEMIPGCLFKCDSNFGSYFPLFKMIGVCERATAGHYARCLERIAQSVGTNEMLQNEWQSVAKAISLLFRCLRSYNEDEKVMNVQDLFLPDSQMKMKKSTVLCVSDSPFFQERCRSLDCSMFLGFRRLEIDETEASFNLLPLEHRPRLLRRLVKEQVSEGSRKSASKGRMSQRYEDRMLSEEFITGAVRLAMQARTETNPTDAAQQIRQNLCRINIVEVPSLSTVLVHEGTEIPNSSRELDSFYEKERGSEREAARIIVYICSTPRLTSRIIETLTLALKILPGFTHLENDILQMMLLEEPSAIAELLDVKGIPHHGRADSVFQPPGTFIPVRFHCYLDNSFAIFHPGEYVGYCVYDPALDDQADAVEQSNEEGEDKPENDCPVFIYAKVKRRLQDPQGEGSDTESRPEITAQYEVDIGKEDPVVAVAMQLYKFHRGSRLRELVIHPDPGPCSGAAGQDDMEAVLKTIRQQLRQAHKLPGKEGRRCLLRLLLKWHPDKNLGNEAFCTKVTQLIQAYWQRLCRGEDPSDDETDFAPRSSTSASGNSSGFQRNTWSNFFDRAHRRGARHQRQWSETSSADTSWHQTVGSQPNPQPGEAKRWLRQALVDRDTALGLLPLCEQRHPNFQRSFNWVCLLCHHAAEKALKAMLYNRDSKLRCLRNHVLVTLSDNVQDEDLAEPARSLEAEIGSFNGMRYPDVTEYPKIPSDVFDRVRAETACNLMSKIVNRVKATLSRV